MIYTIELRDKDVAILFIILKEKIKYMIDTSYDLDIKDELFDESMYSLCLISNQLADLLGYEKIPEKLFINLNKDN